MPLQLMNGFNEMKQSGSAPINGWTKSPPGISALQIVGMGKIPSFSQDSGSGFLHVTYAAYLINTLGYSRSCAVLCRSRIVLPFPNIVGWLRHFTCHNLKLSQRAPWTRTHLQLRLLLPGSLMASRHILSRDCSGLTTFEGFCRGQFLSVGSCEF